MSILIYKLYNHKISVIFTANDIFDVTCFSAIYVQHSEPSIAVDKSGPRRFQVAVLEQIHRWRCNIFANLYQEDTKINKKNFEELEAKRKMDDKMKINGLSNDRVPRCALSGISAE